MNAEWPAVGGSTSNIEYVPCELCDADCVFERSKILEHNGRAD